MEIIIDNISYYNLDDVRNMFPNVFVNNKLSSRKLILSLDITTDDYMYAYLKKNVWVPSNELYCKAKILIKKRWIDSKCNKDIINAEIADIPKMVINGKELNIEIRTEGIISIDTILFRVKDIAVEFNVPKLRDNITDKRSSYEENIDYKKINTGGNGPYLYLTYSGFLRFIFVSRGSKVVLEIQKWMMDIIYNCQFGNKEEKINLMKTILPDYQNIVYDIFSKFTFSCVYLLGIGNYKEYLNVYKFGRTNDFCRRYREHSKMYNCTPTVCILQYIDEDYLSKAEVEIKNYMNDINTLIQTENHDELVSLTEKQVKSVMTIYKNIGHTYSAKTDILQEQINKLTHQIELLEKDNRIRMLEKEKELLSKDNKILTLENELLKINKYS